MTFIDGARPLQPGQVMAGRAVTLRFIPHRPDLAEDKPKREQSAEYVAIELCGPGEVLVIDAIQCGGVLVRPGDAVGGRRRRDSR